MFVTRVDWVAGKVSTEPPPDSVFKFQPPEGYTRANTFEDLFDPPLFKRPPAAPPAGPSHRDPESRAHTATNRMAAAR
jgi:hypothetical protein